MEQFQSHNISRQNINITFQIVTLFESMVYHPLRAMTVNTKKIVTCPNINDVLCGRGSGPYSHTGNKQFRDVVAEHKISYNTVDNHLKTLIAEEVVQFIQRQSPPGRFLSKSGDTWYEVPHDVAVQKTKQALREKTKWAKNDEHIAINDDASNSSANQSPKRRRRRRRRTNLSSSNPTDIETYDSPNEDHTIQDKPHETDSEMVDEQTTCSVDNKVPLYSKEDFFEVKDVEEIKEALFSTKDNIHYGKGIKLDDIDMLIIDMLHEDNAKYESDSPVTHSDTRFQGNIPKNDCHIFLDKQKYDITSFAEELYDSWAAKGKKNINFQKTSDCRNQVVAIAA